MIANMEKQLSPLTLPLHTTSPPVKMYLPFKYVLSEKLITYKDSQVLIQCKVQDQKLLNKSHLSGTPSYHLLFV